MFGERIAPAPDIGNALGRSRLNAMMMMMMMATGALAHDMRRYRMRGAMSVQSG
jgi:hypothetical protein